MPNDVAVELFYDGSWRDLVVSDDVLADTPIIITRGDGDEGAAIRPCSISLRLNNDDDMFRTSNPESPLYGKAGVNTRLRVSVAGVVRASGEVSSWSCSQSRDFQKSPKRGKAWTDIVANGILYRINQWSETVKSTMIKGMLSFRDDLTGVWPLEDESGSTSLSQFVSGGYPGTYSGSVNLGQDERPGGSARSVQISTGGRIGGRFIRSGNSGWQISFATKLPATPGSATYENVMTWTDSTGRLWVFQVNSTLWRWEVYDTDGLVLASASALHGSYIPTRWIRWRVKVTVSGSTVTLEPAWYGEGDSSFVSISDTFTGTSTGYLNTWEAVGLGYNNGGWYTGVFGLNDSTASLFNSGVLADFNGHVGETTGERFLRLMSEAGISAAINGVASESTPMAAQPVDTLGNLLVEIRDTEDGVIADAKGAVNPFFTLRRARYNQTAVRFDASDPDSSGFPNLPAEVTDDLPIGNVVTASQRDGGEYTDSDTTSAMGTQAPPNGKGELRQRVDVNVENEGEDLPVQARWWLRRGTVNLPRYPQVTVNLAALDAARVAEIENITIGSVLEIVGYREYTIRLFVIGYTETIGWPNQRTITFTCAPDQQFQVGVFDSEAARYDLRTAKLASSVGPSATTIPILITDNEAWSSTSAYEVLIAGERIGVPAGGMSARAGVPGAYTQNLTGAVRSRNGIRKTLPAGSEVHVATPGRYAR